MNLDQFSQRAEELRADSREFGNDLYALAADEIEALAGEVERLQANLARAAFVAAHLHQMIDQKTWRSTGGDDGQGHYEGDHRAEQIFDEIQGWHALAVCVDPKAAK